MKKVIVSFSCSMFVLFSVIAQQKTIQERLGYSKDTKLLIIHEMIWVYRNLKTPPAFMLWKKEV
jgi:hypothetical protein